MRTTVLDDAVLTRLDAGLQRMNPLQAGAIDACAQTAPDPIVVVDGPPGAGKTTVCAYGALQYLRNRMNDGRPHHVVILSYTNTSADRCLEALQELGVTHDLAVRVMPRGGRVPHGADARFFLRFDREADLPRAEQEQLRSARVLLATTYAANRALRQTRRPLLVLDEISQVSMGTYLGLLAEGRGGGRDIDGLVLVGDPAQLPVVTSQRVLQTNAASYLLAQVPELRPHQLDVQYRMHATICGVVNKAREVLGTYRLETAEMAQVRTLQTIRGPDGRPKYGEPTTVERSAWAVPLVEPMSPVVAVNTDGLEGVETPVGPSWRHDAEAEATVGIARLMKAAYRGLDPVLLSPYTVQREAMDALCGGELDCLSVHESQGREYDCVILSMTRKNAEGKVGFLGELLPLSYVALSRARCKLIVLLSFRTFNGSRFPQPIVSHLLNHPSVARIDATAEMRNWIP
jgi:DNA replication ATP-dependent helicase Dna2